MPITITNKSFRDIWGNVTNYLKANTGDFVICELSIEDEIAVDTATGGNTLQQNGLSNIITWVGGDFEQEGFRSGQSIDIVRYTILTGAILDSVSTTINWVSGSEMEVASTLGSWYSLPNEAIKISSNATRNGLEINVNMVGNGSQGNEFSLIDGEVTTFTFDLTGLLPLNSVAGVQVGNRSGMFSLTSNMTLQSVSGSKRDYTMEVNFQMSGLYNSANFDFNNCLKLYVKQKWQTNIGEPFDNTIQIFNDDADTGWFNQAFNTGVIDATIIQSISEISYCEPTEVEFIVDSASSDFGLGGAYVSGLDDYYKVKPNSATNYAMQIPTTDMFVGQSLVSEANDETAKWFLEYLSISTNGTEHTIKCLITPSPAFSNFMANRSVGDRTFYFWCRFGNVNLLVFNGQLTCSPKATQPLDMRFSDYLDHGNNTLDTSNLVRGTTGNVEDEFAFVGKFLFPTAITMDYVNARIEAYNITSEDSFTLQQVSFNLNGIPIVNDQYVLNLTAPVLTELPTTSNKRIARLDNDATFVFPKAYMVKLYFPFIYRWETWINQINANADFYPNDQVRNYVPFGNQDDWKLRLVVDNLRTEINDYNIQELVNYQYTDFINIDDYDHDANILQEIELYIDSTSQNVQVVTEGLLMRVVATHTLVNGASWIPSSVWGMITIEATESNPRWISSTAIDYDNNTLNPLFPLNGLTRCQLTFPTPDVARLECFFNPDDINLTNGVKFTSKIKGCSDGEVVKLATDGQQKLTTSGDKKIKT